MSWRSISKIIHAVQKSEGIGSSVRRSIGVVGMRNFTPFVLLDHFNISPDAGFPDHPHRGQETITLVTKNYMMHEDFTGSSGILRPGDLQFMTAGKGICHSEMPYSKDGENIEGMQLWVDLPKELKDSEPRYRDLKAEEIPIVRPNDKVEVKVISGKSYGVESIKDLAYTPMDYYWYSIKPGGEFQQEINPQYNAFIYILKGNLEIENKDGGFEHVEQNHSIFFDRNGKDKGVRGRVLETNTDRTEFVLIAGKALDQPILQYGPFVVTSKTGVHNALFDYQTYSNGFERAKNWQSEISNGVSKKIFEKNTE